MKVKGTPVITSIESKRSFTKLEFQIDLGRFKNVKQAPLTKIPSDMLKILKKRCLDLAVSFPSVTIKFNDSILTSCFLTYCAQYIHKSNNSSISSEPKGPLLNDLTSLIHIEQVKLAKPSDKMKIGFLIDPKSGSGKIHAIGNRIDITFANGVVTQGGTHHQQALELLKAIAESVTDTYQKNNPTCKVNTKKIIQSILMVVHLIATDVKFDSQSKVRLISTHKLTKKPIDVNCSGPFYSQYAQLQGVIRKQCAGDSFRLFKTIQAEGGN